MRRVLFLSTMLVISAMTVAQGGTPRFDGSIPIYPKSTLATAGGENDSQIAAKLKTGTEATFVTNDSVSTVAAWYRKHLPPIYVMKSSGGAEQFTSEDGNQVNVYAHQTTQYRTRIVILPQ